MKVVFKAFEATAIREIRKVTDVASIHPLHFLILQKVSDKT